MGERQSGIRKAMAGAVICHEKIGRWTHDSFLWHTDIDALARSVPSIHSFIHSLSTAIEGYNLIRDCCDNEQTFERGSCEARRGSNEISETILETAGQ